jgi:hypothetical protein
MKTNGSRKSKPSWYDTPNPNYRKAADGIAKHNGVMTLPERFFALEGENSDLANLARWFSTGEDGVIPYQDGHYLVTPLPGGASDEDALALAHELFASMIGVAFAMDGQKLKARLVGISRYDPATGNVSTPTVAKGGMVAKKPVIAVNVRVEGVADQPPGPSQGESLLELAESNEDLQRACTCWVGWIMTGEIYRWPWMPWNSGPAAKLSC